MRTSRRQALAGMGALLLCALGSKAHADTYPGRTIRVIVPRAPGGGSDIIARLLSQGMQQKSGQSFIVENRPDASAVVGAVQVAHATPDGYTVFLADNAFYQNPAVIRKLPYDTLKDFSGVTMLAQAPVIVVVNPSVPASDVKTLDDAKAQNIKVGVPAYSPMSEYADEHDIPHATFFQNYQVIDALISGQVNAAMIWSGSISQAKLSHPEAEFEMVKGYQPPDEMRFDNAWGIKEKEVELLKFVDEEFAAMLKSGETRRISERYGVPFFPPLNNAEQ